MFHSVTINGKNTWNDYHMVPANGIYLPTPPEQKRTTIDLKTGNGLLDVSTVLTGYPLFQNRSGELQYLILDPWDLEDYVEDTTNLSFKSLKNIFLRVAGSNYATSINEMFSYWEQHGFMNSSYIVLVAISNDESKIAVTVYQVGNNYLRNGKPFKQTCYDYYTFGHYNSNVYWKYVYRACAKSNTFTKSDYNNSGLSVERYLSPNWSDELPLVFPNNNTMENNTDNKIYISNSVWDVNSSTSYIYNQNFYKIINPTHTMPNAYDVYSQLLNDLHGTTGTMIFEDDPYWYYTGNFTVRSMETNSIRRAVSIGYDVAPYKLRSSQATKIINGIDTSTWASITIGEDELFSMPVIPSVTISGTFDTSETATIKFTKSNGSYVEKTVTSAGTKTGPDVVLYKQATVQFKAASGKTASITFRPGRL